MEGPAACISAPRPVPHARKTRLAFVCHARAPQTDVKEDQQEDHLPAETLEE